MKARLRLQEGRKTGKGAAQTRQVRSEQRLFLASDAGPPAGRPTCECPPARKASRHFIRDRATARGAFRVFRRIRRST
jgi:hypothetical protein